MGKLFYPLNVMHHVVHIRPVDLQFLPESRERERCIYYVLLPSRGQFYKE